MKYTHALFTLLAGFLPLTGNADVELPNIFGNHMVLQRGAPASAMIISEWLGWECTLFVASGLCDASSDSCAVVEAIPICTTVMVCEFILVFGWRKCHRHCNSHPVLHNQTPAQPADC